MVLVQGIQKRAEERLARLLREGVVTDVSPAFINGEERILVGVAAQTNPQAPDYDRAALESVRARLREALQDIPFQILGEYASKPARNETLDRVAMPKGAPLEIPARAEAPAPAAEDGALEIIEGRIAQLESLTRAVSTDMHHLEGDLQSRLIRLERTVARVPSRGFIVAATVLNLLLVALILAFPTAVSSGLRQAWDLALRLANP